MKWPQCEREWQPEGNPVCPGCGASIFPKAEAFTSAYDVLRYIYLRFGEEFMRDGLRVSACFADLAPMMKKERRVMSYFLECGGHVQLLDSLPRGTAEMQMTSKRIVRQMTQELLVAENASRIITEAFLRAISGQSAPDEKSSKAPTRHGKKTVAPLDLSGCEDFKITGRTLLKYKGNKKVVEVPEGIRIIGKRAFAENKTVEEVKLPESIVKIQESAFRSCARLHSVNLPEGLQELQDFAFASSGLKSVCIPSSLMFFGPYVFMNSKLESAVIPGSIKAVPTGTFESCQVLSEVILCNGVSEIGKGAFDACPALQTITIPDTVDTILCGQFRPHIFCGTDRIQTVNASEQWKKTHLPYYREMLPAKRPADNYVIKDGVLIRYYGRAAHPSIPARVRSIGPSAFHNNSHIVGISIPEGVQEIGENAFSLCRNLQSLTLPGSLRRVERYAFGYTAIESLTVPKGVREMASRAFTFCGELRRVTLPDSLSDASYDAFVGCGNIHTIHASPLWKRRNQELIRRMLGKRK